MNELQRTPNELAGYWRRFDWRESFFTPSICILQALTLCGRTASGAGTSRETAYLRCMGETAEIHALSARRQKGQDDYQSLRDGLAARADPEGARRGALMEAYERFAIMRWWQGIQPARPLADDWLAGVGLADRLERARKGAALRRRTGWWRVDGGTGPHVVICRSMSPEGQDTVLGFGADPDPVRAAVKAMRELFLMEMNLMELMAARRTGREVELQPLQDRILSYGRRAPQLLPPDSDVAPQPAAALSPPGDWFDANITMICITPADGPLDVWMCRPDLPAPQPDRAIGLPFL